MIKKSKKSQGFLTENIIFIILNVIFFSLMFLFLARVGTDTSTIEKVYVRQIALAIDEMKPGTEIILFLPKLFETAEKNKFTGNIFEGSLYDDGLLVLTLDKGKGASMRYFTKLNSGAIIPDSSKKTVTIKA